jgi:hypothetical protein
MSNYGKQPDDVKYVFCATRSLEIRIQFKPTESGGPNINYAARVPQNTDIVRCTVDVIRYMSEGMKVFMNATLGIWSCA